MPDRYRGIVMQIGIASDQRYRDYMEDRVVTGVVGDAFVVGVFDGHGGHLVAEHAAGHALKLVEAALSRHATADAMWAEVFAGLDSSIPECGSTGTVLCLRDRDLSVAWVGDSRAVLVTKSGGRILTPDHRIDRKDERRRVVEAGAVIDNPYAVDPLSSRGLMVTRALGDHELRRIGITAEPEIVTVPIGETEVGVVVATDGLWDVVGAAEAALVCRELAPEPAARRLVDIVIDRNGSDNVSVVVARFSWASTAQ